MLDLTGAFLRRVMGGWIAQAAVMLDEVFTRSSVLRPIKGFRKAWCIETVSQRYLYSIEKPLVYLFSSYIQ